MRRRRRKENYGNVEEEGKTIKNEGEEKGNQKMRRRRRRESNKNVEEEKEERK